MPIEAPLSNGQLYSWREIETYPAEWLAEANQPGTWDLRGFSYSRVETALRRLVETHEPLRTSYRLLDGVPVQVVHQEIELPVERIDRVITDLGEVARTTQRLCQAPFPMTGGLCWRAQLVSNGGQPMFMALAFSHLITDGWATEELMAQFRLLLADPDADGFATRVGPSPTELARRQAARDWQARQHGAERYWRALLTDPGITRLAGAPAGRRIQATLHAQRLGGLAAVAADRLGVTMPSVFAGLLGAALATHLDARRVALCLMSSNRFAPEHRHVVGTLNQLIPIVIGADGAESVGAHLAAVHWAGTKAYRHACYDVDQIAALAAHTDGVDRTGDWFNRLFQCWFNYLGLDDTPCDPAASTPAELAWAAAPRQTREPLNMRVTVRGGQTGVQLRVDPAVIPAGALVRILRTMALGIQLAATEPDRPLADVLAGTGDLSPALFPADPAW